LPVRPAARKAGGGLLVPACWRRGAGA